MSSITILTNKSNTFGLSKDVEVLRRALGGRGAQIRVCDPLEVPSYSDIAIHLEVPSYVWMPWSARNVLVVNPEWFVREAWVPYLSRFDKIVFKDCVSKILFQKELGLPEEQLSLCPWAMSPAANVTKAFPAIEEALWLLGASRSKRAYVPKLLEAWPSTAPILHIYTTTPLDLSGVPMPQNAKIHIQDLPAEEREKLQAKYRIHVACSAAEGFGYTAAEAEASGAFTILNSLPVYSQDYSQDLSGTAFLPAALVQRGLAYVDSGSAPIGAALANALEAFKAYEAKNAEARRAASRNRWDAFVGVWGDLVAPWLGAKRPAELKVLPPVLLPEDCPPISVVTLVYNRKNFFDLACHNIMISDYPKDKIEWIIVDDSDVPAEQNTDRILATIHAAAPLKGVYVPLAKKTAVAEKRNQGIQRASADIVLMMDDDDHYPETSFRRRVAWLLKHPWKPRATACTTIACYDLLRGISAVNVPPIDIPLSQRISEATLTFYKGWWEERKFPKTVVVGEGEEFVSGREVDVLELPPQQIIVAFSHGKNVSSRRVPSDANVTPGCFWGFPREYLQFIHRLAGVKVVG